MHERAVAQGGSNPGRTANKAREHLRAVMAGARAPFLPQVHLTSRFATLGPECRLARHPSPSPALGVMSRWSNFRHYAETYATAPPLDSTDKEFCETSHCGRGSCTGGVLRFGRLVSFLFPGELP